MEQRERGAVPSSERDVRCGFWRVLLSALGALRVASVQRVHAAAGSECTAVGCSVECCSFIPSFNNIVWSVATYHWSRGGAPYGVQEPNRRRSALQQRRGVCRDRSEFKNRTEQDSLLDFISVISATATIKYISKQNQGQGKHTWRTTRVPILFSVPIAADMVGACKIQGHRGKAACARSFRMGMPPFWSERRRMSRASTKCTEVSAGRHKRRAQMGGVEVSAGRHKSDCRSTRPERIKKAFDFAAWKGGVRCSDAVLVMAAWLARCRPAAVQRAARSHATASGSPIREEFGR